MIHVLLSGDPEKGRITVSRLSNGNQEDPDSDIAKAYYMAEGAANVVFRLEPVDAEQLEKMPQGLLLRLRKGKMEPWASEEHAPPVFADLSKNIEFLETEVLPAFEADDIVRFWLASIAPGVIKLFNDVLHLAEVVGTRPEKRRGWFLLEDQTEALILENMQPAPNEDAILVDFKPKWLHMSPSAPDHSVRCRTCAHDIKTGKPLAKRFCPLLLSSGSPREIRRVVDTILPNMPANAHHWNIQVVRQLLAFYFWSDDRGKALLGPLKSLQTQYDPQGVLCLTSEPRPARPDNIDTVYSKLVQYVVENNKGEIPDLAKAMTFRDVSIMIKITHTIDKDGIHWYELSPKLADFDIKVMNETKIKKWVEDELSLITYYKAEEIPATPSMDEVCTLFHQYQVNALTGLNLSNTT